MASVFIHNKVDNYDNWRATFDSFEQLRADSGVTRAKVYRTTGDDQGVTVLLDFATGDQAQAFIESDGDFGLQFEPIVAASLDDPAP